MCRSVITLAFHLSSSLRCIVLWFLTAGVCYFSTNCDAQWHTSGMFAVVRHSHINIFLIVNRGCTARLTFFYYEQLYKQLKEYYFNCVEVVFLAFYKVRSPAENVWLALEAGNSY